MAEAYACLVSRSTRRYGLALGLVAAVVVMSLLIVAPRTVVCSCGDGFANAAESNLQTALAGVQMYYSENHTYEGLVPASWDAIDTGLSEVASAQSSTEPHTVSIDAAPTTVVVVALQDGYCWGVLSVMQKRAQPYFAAYPITGGVGAYFFVTAPSSGSGCNAGSARPPAQLDGGRALVRFVNGSGGFSELLPDRND